MLASITQCPRTAAKRQLNLAYKMKAIKVTANMVYSTKSFEEETGIVKDIRRIMSASDSKITEIDTFIEEYEDANFKLADSQRDAVHGVLSIRSKSSLADQARAKQQSQNGCSLCPSASVRWRFQCCASGSDGKSRKKNV